MMELEATLVPLGILSPRGTSSGLLGSCRLVCTVGIDCSRQAAKLGTLDQLGGDGGGRAMFKVLLNF